MQLDKLYELAEAAKKDKSLLPNHKPYVPKELNRHKSELSDLVGLLQDDIESIDTCNQFRNEIKKINNALLAYGKKGDNKKNENK